MSVIWMIGCVVSLAIWLKFTEEIDDPSALWGRYGLRYGLGLIVALLSWAAVLVVPICWAFTKTWDEREPEPPETIPEQRSDWHERALANLEGRQVPMKSRMGR